MEETKEIRGERDIGRNERREKNISNEGQLEILYKRRERKDRKRRE